ncbi:hypothetical protein [Chryseolinea sp. H1M3-3]|uniref:DUF6929 family protein n=1 Tax=Chryseolinea sp. H1M3-3 TaxID=3034144 RepID=UPI0023EB8200|nr:hypothetical protein [Chryseolinea sp. H1M3-3]
MKPTIELLKSQVLTEFASGSSINYANDKLYLIGDDANTILILDTDYKKIDSIRLFDHPETRIPKSKKSDLEASTFMSVNGTLHLLILGSASRSQRKKVILMPLESLNLNKPYFREYDSGEFIKRVVGNGIDEVNIEGITVIGNHLVLANRGNNSNQKNHLIITGNYFWEKQMEAPLHIRQLLIPPGIKAFAGVSEVCYLASKDILLFTLCSEATSNAYDDGVIGDSYIGWINNISNKIDDLTVTLDGTVNLSGVSDEFKGQKIEGICVQEMTDDKAIIHLVSDNDGEVSKLFKIKLF